MAGGYRQAQPSLGAHAPDEASSGAREQTAVYSASTSTTSAPGPMERRQPIRLDWRRAGGYKERAFFNDYYNRVYLIPTIMDLGAVAVETKRSFFVWNAWLSWTSVTSVLQENADGTIISGPMPGERYAPLGIREYEATAFEDGPSAFEARYLLVFDKPDRPALLILGERSRLLPFGVNWRESYQVTKDYKTDILTSRSGREQRRAGRQSPRKTIEFQSLARMAQLRAFNRHMATWQNRSIILGEETKFAVVQNDTLAGNSVFAVDRVPEWALPGTPVFVRSDYDSVVSEIDSIVGSNIVLTGPVPHHMPAGSFILKAIYGRLQDELQSTRQTAGVAETPIKMDVTAGSERRTTRPIERVLAGRPVFLLKPNWKQAPQVTYVHPRETLDYDFGRVQVFTPVDFTTRRMSYLFSESGEGDAEQVENLFDLMRGQAGEFYYPSYENDLTFETALIAGTRNMTIPGREVFDVYEGDTVHRAVAVFLKDGRSFVNNLFGPVVLDQYEDTLLTFAEEWPEAIEPRDVQMVSWLFACRFGSDKLVTEWLTRTVAQVKTTFVTLEDLPV